jgi:hypothetical protein
VTPEGKIAASILMLLGIGLFSAVTASVTSYMLSTGSADASIPKTIGDLGQLRSAGLLTDAEFEAKKAELLGRL